MWNQQYAYSGPFEFQPQTGYSQGGYPTAYSSSLQNHYMREPFVTIEEMDGDDDSSEDQAILPASNVVSD